VKRGDVCWVILDPTKGSEQAGRRPGVVISPDSMNKTLNIRVIVPLTTKTKEWPSRVNTSFQGEVGQAQCEQIRTVSLDRLEGPVEKISDLELVEILSTLKALYGEP